VIVAGGWLGSQGGSRSEDLTCYTSPVQHVEYHWPQGHSAFVYAFAAFAYIFIAVNVVWLWWHYRPCETCGEYRSGCRCKARSY